MWLEYVQRNSNYRSTTDGIAEDRRRMQTAIEKRNATMAARNTRFTDQPRETTDDVYSRLTGERRNERALATTTSNTQGTGASRPAPPK